VDPDHLPGVFDGTQVQGTMELPRGSAVLSDIVALEAGAVVGDVVFVEGLSYNATSGTSEPRFVNLTIEGIVTIPSGWEPPLFSAGGVPSDRFIAVHIRDGTWLSSELFGQEIDGATFEILVDRNLVLNPYDVVWSQRNLARIGSEIRLVAAPYGETTLYDLVSPIVAGLDVVLPLFRTVYVLLSIPLIILGISLGAVGVDLGHSERRRELAVLKTRGATGSQVWRVLAMESVIVGCLAAILGLIAGVGISRLVAPFVTFFVLAIPRGAVHMGRVLADALGGELDVVLVRKLRAPDSPELAVGAIDESGWAFVAEYARSAGADEAYLAREKRTQLDTLRRRRAQYTPARPPNQTPTSDPATASKVRLIWTLLSPQFLRHVVAGTWVME